MSIKSEIIVEPAYVCLRCTGTCSSVSDLKPVILTAMDAVQKTQRRKILIDANGVKGQLSTLDRYEAAIFLSEQNIEKPVWFTALAVVAQEPLVDPTRFAETVARNRGANARIFTDLDEAIAWLTSA